jgi:hypothetical protein
VYSKESSRVCAKGKKEGGRGGGLHNKGNIKETGRDIASTWLEGHWRWHYRFGAAVGG